MAVEPATAPLNVAQPVSEVFGRSHPCSPLPNEQARRPPADADEGRRSSGSLRSPDRQTSGRRWCAEDPRSWLPPVACAGFCSARGA